MRGLLSSDPNLTKKSAVDTALLQLRHRAANKAHWGRMLEQAIQKQENEAPIERGEDANNS